jgi:hypothetical protein
MTETDIMSRILARISQLPGILAYRQNSGLFVTPTGARVRAAVPGASDIIAIYGGRFFALEVKTDTGSQRPSQRAYQRAVERAGGIYAVVRSPEQALSILGSAA